MFIEKFRALFCNDLFGLRPLAKMILNASTSEGPIIFQRNHPCVFGKHVDAHQQVTVAVVKFLHGLHIG